jgi:hypothetical protein
MDDFNVRSIENGVHCNFNWEGNVFDVSQTEGKPLPEYVVPSLTGEANEDRLAR